MARTRRDWRPHALYHVFSRGSNRGRIVVDARDLADLEHLLLDGLRRTGVEALAWSLMPNHWHGLLRCPEDERGLSPLLCLVNRRHSLRSNRRHGRRAHLFESPFGCVLQEREAQLLWTVRYVVRNPLEAGLCTSMDGARWTSYPHTAGLRPPPDVLARDAVLRLFGDDPSVAVGRFRSFVCSTGTPPSPPCPFPTRAPEDNPYQVRP